MHAPRTRVVRVEALVTTSRRLEKSLSVECGVITNHVTLYKDDFSSLGESLTTLTTLSTDGCRTSSSDGRVLAMPTKTLYYRKADEAAWETAERIAKRRQQPFSKVVSALVKAWVEDNETGLAKEMGLAPGIKPPTSMIPPETLRKEQIADDIRAKVRELLDEMDAVKTEIPDEEDDL
jgi:hypothetical protein